MGGDRDNDNESFMSRHFPDATRLRQHKKETHRQQQAGPRGHNRAASADQDGAPLRMPGNSSVGPDTELSYRSEGIQNRVIQQLKRGQIRYQSRLDLHGSTVEQAYTTVIHFLQNARDNGLYCVLIIHGQGYRSASGVPVLKQNLEYWLRRHDGVLAFQSAQPRDGGKGAVYVLLRRRRKRP